MKYFIAFSILTLNTLSICAETSIESEQEKFSYLVGLSVATEIQAKVAQQDIALDVAAFLQAIEDVLKNNPLKINNEEMQKSLDEYQEKESIKFKDQVAKNTQLAKVFFTKNKQQKGVIELPSGLQYKVIKAGTGAQAKAGSSVTVHYLGALLNGTVFDSSYDRGEPVTLALTQVIKGWQEVIPKMKEGAKWQIYIPAKLAYGDKSVGGIITPASALIFDIELISANP